jgi:hypothetical protein
VITADAINAAYAKLTTAQVQGFNAAGGVLDAKEKLARRRAALLDSGEIDGKNAETREGQLRARTEHELGYVETAESLMRQADLTLRCAQLEVDRCKTLLKLLEVTGIKASVTSESEPFMYGAKP